ncbi:MAG TPA: Fur family transcriptional regulator [Terriglobales bacterium]|nr:Fur family transcriptional regulator [Terriglobales bacterium]
MSEPSPLAAPLAQRIDLAQEMKRRGVRLTRQRAAVLAAIQQATRHLDAESLWRLAQARDATVNLATVYRTLGMLKKMGLVDELDLMHLEGEKHFYEVSRSQSHLHLACFECGKIEEYQTEQYVKLQAEVESVCGFTIKTGRLEFGGVCRTCRK